MKLLVIPDAHAHPDYDNDRFTWLGKFIVDEKPDTIVCLGDFADMPSLSSYDRGKKSFEGRRYYRDCDAAIDAQQALWGPLLDFNDVRRKRKEKRYVPRTVMLLGNHEDRTNRAVNESPELDQTIGVEDLAYGAWWDEVWDFNETVVVAGFAFCHFFSSGLLGRPIGGLNPAGSILSKHHHSAICGHSHTLDFAERTRADGKKMSAIVGGCYVHEEYIESWCKNTRSTWWNGVLLIAGAEDGYYEELRFITQDSLKRKYA